MSKEKTIVVKFIKFWTPYIKGDLAGFKKDFAEKLIKKGIAVKYKK